MFSSYLILLCFGRCLVLIAKSACAPSSLTRGRGGVRAPTQAGPHALNIKTRMTVRNNTAHKSLDQEYTRYIYIIYIYKKKHTHCWHLLTTAACCCCHQYVRGTASRTQLVSDTSPPLSVSSRSVVFFSSFEAKPAVSFLSRGKSQELSFSA